MHAVPWLGSKHLPLHEQGISAACKSCSKRLAIVYKEVVYFLQDHTSSIKDVSDFTSASGPTTGLMAYNGEVSESAGSAGQTLAPPSSTLFVRKPSITNSRG